MEKYQFNKKDKVRGLLREFQPLMQAESILEHQNGEIYVNHQEDIQTVMIYDGVANIYLAGDSKNQAFNEKFYDFLFEVLPNRQKDSDDVDFYIHLSESFKRDEKVLEVFRNHHLFMENRKYYRYETKFANQVSEPLEGYQLVAVNHELLKQASLENLDEVVEWMTTEQWTSVEDFLTNGFGFCLLKDECIVSWCMADFVTDEKCEIGIETDEDYQGQGLATYLIKHTLEHAKSIGIKEVGWQCFDSNQASKRTALKVGFTLELAYAPYFGWYHPLDNLLVHANMHYEKEDYHGAKELLDQFVEAMTVKEAYLSSGLMANHDSLGNVWVRMADIKLRLGDKTSAIADLVKAKEHGFRAFKNLRKHPVFCEIAEDLETLI